MRTILISAILGALGGIIYDTFSNPTISSPIMSGLIVGSVIGWVTAFILGLFLIQTERKTTELKLISATRASHGGYFAIKIEWEEENGEKKQLICSPFPITGLPLAVIRTGEPKLSRVEELVLENQEGIRKWTIYEKSNAAYWISVPQECLDPVGGFYGIEFSS